MCWAQSLPGKRQFSSFARTTWEVLQQLREISELFVGSGLGAAGQGQQDFNDLKSNPHLCEDRAGIVVISRREKHVSNERASA